MDTINFLLEKRNTHQTTSVFASIHINGVSLIDMLQKQELVFAKKENTESIAGNYDWLSPQKLYTHLKHPADYNLDNDGKVEILDCSCGAAGCWPMKVKIIENENNILWCEFEQPFRTIDSFNHWNYDDFGAFSFDKENFFSELENLKIDDIETSDI